MRGAGWLWGINRCLLLFVTSNMRGDFPDSKNPAVSASIQLLFVARAQGPDGGGPLLLMGARDAPVQLQLLCAAASGGGDVEGYDSDDPETAPTAEEKAYPELFRLQLEQKERERQRRLEQRRRRLLRLSQAADTTSSGGGADGKVTPAQQPLLQVEPA